MALPPQTGRARCCSLWQTLVQKGVPLDATGFQMYITPTSLSEVSSRRLIWMSLRYLVMEERNWRDCLHSDFSFPAFLSLPSQGCWSGSPTVRRWPCTQRCPASPELMCFHGRKDGTEAADAFPDVSFLFLLLLSVHKGLTPSLLVCCFNQLPPNLQVQLFPLPDQLNS